MRLVVQRRELRSLAIGTAAGLVAGLGGLGGGIVMVPMLGGLLHLPQHRAHATSLAVVILTSFAGGLAYLRGGFIEWSLVLYFAVGSLVGVVIGAKAMPHLPAMALRRAFGVLLIVVAFVLVLRSL